MWVVAVKKKQPAGGKNKKKMMTNTFRTFRRGPKRMEAKGTC